MTCEACDRIAGNERGENPYAVARLTTGYVVLHPTQYFRGYTLFVARTCATELHALEAAERNEFLREMAEVAHAVARVCNPRKLNYELLGNGVPHLHWHLFPRYDTDPHPGGPVWEDLSFLRNLWIEGAQLPDAERDDLRGALLRELETADVTIERAFVSPR